MWRNDRCHAYMHVGADPSAIHTPNKKNGEVLVVLNSGQFGGKANAKKGGEGRRVHRSVDKKERGPRGVQRSTRLDGWFFR